MKSSFRGLKETFGGSVSELGRSRPQHRAKATIGRRRDPRSGKASKASRRPELAEKNRQKSGAAGDAERGRRGNQQRGRKTERPPSDERSETRRPASDPPCGTRRQRRKLPRKVICVARVGGWVFFYAWSCPAGLQAGGCVTRRRLAAPQ